MRIHLIAVGTRMPQWVQTAYEEYAKRLPKECQLVLKEIEPAKRSKSTSVANLKSEEKKRILAALPKDAFIVALDVTGKNISTEVLAEKLSEWMFSGRDIVLLVGGPDGLHEDCLRLADWRWSLSALTFPHPVVRVILAEQIYRGWSITQNHPYHRA